MCFFFVPNFPESQLVECFTQRVLCARTPQASRASSLKSKICLGCHDTSAKQQTYTENVLSPSVSHRTTFGQAGQPAAGGGLFGGGAATTSTPAFGQPAGGGFLFLLAHAPLLAALSAGLVFASQPRERDLRQSIWRESDHRNIVRLLILFLDLHTATNTTGTGLFGSTQQQPATGMCARPRRECGDRAPSTRLLCPEQQSFCAVSLSAPCEPACTCLRWVRIRS